MNKSELIDAIAKESGLSKKDVDAALKSFVGVVSDALQKKEKVQLIGFGTFETGERAARVGKNPRTHEEIKIAASTQVKFKAGKALKEKVNTKPAKKAKKSKKAK
ncbi:MAG: HU family DNA-binding protein [Oscillospiraceae bacterium]|nr:HU family DNA-binding protein [Oscillospiraceae bacterium]